ncbi:Asp-tRNA(Asn)/Glu-tRNA(Gln) amidotransferase subunit GatC [candidate division KSB1 bacterium]|nr:Asp-tRNA(Asn)/Glu-tRNA(Gln) amidotransferase subunit GatC [candidate division KSB1 bacterium]
MNITKSDVEKVAALAKLKFSENELEKLTNELGTIVDYFEKLNEVDTSSIARISHIHDIENVTREDQVEQWLSQEEALRNAPDQKNGFFSVPKVISNE